MLEDTSLFFAFNNNARKTRTPISGHFELTPRCTLDCKMCYIHLTEEQMKSRKELPASEWIRIIDEACEEGLLFAMLTGGECLMHKDFREIYLHMKEKNLFIAVKTNGTLLTDEYIEFFKNNPPTSLRFSLYGASEEGYYNVTGRRQFNRVRSAILKSKEAGLNIKVSVTVSRYLKDELFDIIDFLRENKIPYGVDMEMHQANEDTGRDISDFALTADEIVDLSLKMHQRYSDKPLYNNSPVDVPEYDTSGKTFKSLNCAAGKQLFTVKWDGSMQPCFVSEDSVSVLGMPFKEAWKQVCKISDETVVPIECVSCKLLKRCTACAYTRMDPHDFGHRDPNICRSTVMKYNAGLIKL